MIKLINASCMDAKIFLIFILYDMSLIKKHSIYTSAKLLKINVAFYGKFIFIRLFYKLIVIIWKN